jgi:alcohol dehydrogenase YqhD (iron-dependent ADH family)
VSATVTSLVRPTALLAGTGAATCALIDVPAGDVAVLHDPAVEWVVESVRDAHSRHDLCARPVHRAPTFDDVEATAAWLADRPGAPLLAIGGGTVLDLAKLSAIAVRDHATVGRIRRRARRAGFVLLPRVVTRSVPLLALPTTIGTGAEVSAVACVDDDHGHRTLVHSPQLRPDLAILDPLATRTLPIRLVREGALEALLRVAGPEIASPSSIPMARFEALDLARRLALALDTCRTEDGADDELRLAIAQLSGATHCGWALTGRSQYPSPLWFVATELSKVLKVTKMTATALLLSPWLQRVADGDARWGHRERLAEVWTTLFGAPPGADVAGPARAQLERWRLSTAITRPAPGVADETARRAVRRWGGRLPMLGRFGHEDIASLVGHAVGVA